MTNEQDIKTAMLLANGNLTNYKEILSNSKNTEAHERLIAIIQAYEVTHQALEKQVPKKVEKHKGAMSETLFNCPSCGKIFFYPIKVEFCDSCGQRLDWSDIDD